MDMLNTEMLEHVTVKTGGRDKKVYRPKTD
jgi:hypothetical protein